MKIFTALFFVAVLPATAQRVEVAHKLDFAGITLVIRDDARREIQKDVDALTASPRHYQIKVQRARTYFPIIEKIFREEGLPDDFKYLVLQESALISDAVSSSNAVGFWQFKDFTGLEMGLRIDREVDERLNIASSTRAAARYIIKNNQFFDNWLYALQAYQMGAGGVMKSVEDTQPKASRMEITGKTYWYVKKFLAHKIAYEGSVKGRPDRQVVPFQPNGRTTLAHLAKEIKVDEHALRELNKWAKAGVIPDDRPYVVLLPVDGDRPAETLVPTLDATTARAADVAVNPQGPAGTSVSPKINGIRTITASPGDNARSLAARSGVDLPKFLRYNDLKMGDPIVAGQVYFLARKRLKGSEDFHKVSSGESLWEISQRYGIQMKRLRKYNRLAKDAEADTGMMLFLASRRPKEEAVLADVDDPVQVSSAESFNWAVKTESSAEAVETPPVLQSPAPESTLAAIQEVSKDVDSLKILQTTPTSPPEKEVVPTTLPVPERGEHVVQAGETLYSIARLYGRSVMDLVSLNNLSLQDGIRPGQVLRLVDENAVTASSPTVNDEGSKTEIYHEVKTSDTLYSIARRYNVTIKQIMEWNEKKDFSLAVGEKLRIISTQ